MKPKTPLELELAYPFGDSLPAEGERFAIAPDLFWVRMPLPFQLDHINLWLLRDEFRGEPGWTLIDTGITSEQIQQLWERLFERHLDGLPIRRILCTHTHPDHVGLAWWIQKRFGAPLWMSLGEYSMGRVWSSMLPGVELAVGHYRRNGVPEGPRLEAIRARNANYFRTLVPEMPPSFRRIRRGESIRIGQHDWVVIPGIGHSPEHSALYSESRRMLISGDMVLPRISTNVSVTELEPESNPVQWYMESLDLFRSCRDDTLVLPSHGQPFRNLHRRIDQLQAHHRERLGTLLQVCRERPVNAEQAVPIIFRREFDTHQFTFAFGEALAHLHALWYRGDVQRQVSADQVISFAA